MYNFIFLPMTLLFFLQFFRLSEVEMYFFNTAPDDGRDV